MGTALDRYGEALGFWTLPIEQKGDDPLKLKLQIGDGTKLRDIVMDDRNKKDKPFLFNQFSAFMLDIIKRDYPQSEEKRIKGYIEMNQILLFDEAQIAFRYTTREDMEKTKRDTIKDLKKSLVES